MTALLERVRATRLGVAALDGRTRLSYASALPSPRRTLGGEWPAVDDKSLIATLADWLVPYLQHAANRDDLASRRHGRWC